MSGSTVYVISYKYKDSEGKKEEEQKKTVLTVTLVLQQVDALLRDSRVLEYVRISPRYV